MRALTVLVSILVSPYNKYELKSLLNLNLVRFVPSESNNFEKDEISFKKKETEFNLKYED